MLRHFRTVVLSLLLLVAGTQKASAFSLLGAFTAWQDSTLYYTQLADNGGPMNLGEEYRWNTDTITYAFDESFLNYFGTSGVKAAEEAIKILNDLPAMSALSANLTEFPLTAKRTNYRAQTLLLLDMKSLILTTLLEQGGLAAPDRFCFCLRADTHINPGDIPYLSVIMRNFDPITLRPTPYVNGTLYTYHIYHITGPHEADAVEDLVDPLADNYTAVASGMVSLNLGQFYTGLTRDDVAALRYIYSKQNINVENVPTSVLGLAASSPWMPVGVVLTNAYTNTALRPGFDKLTFKRVDFDSLLGSVVVSQTNQVYKDYFFYGGRMYSQILNRSTLTPDILFIAADLGIDTASGTPYVAARSAGWINNDALNGFATLDGPGTIQGQITITLSKLGPNYLNIYPTTITEATASKMLTWGSFDGTANDPITYPNAGDIYSMARDVFKIRGLYNPPWYPVLLGTTNTTTTPGTGGGTNAPPGGA
jgi:hypothetical protein